jgi:hypothetical protein
VSRGVADPERPARDPTNTTPENQAATFRNQDQVWPHRVIRRGDAVRPLPPHARSLADLTFEMGGVRLNFSDDMARRRTAGLLILRDGEIVLERYGMGSGPETRWTSFSTAKSITSTLCGAALHDGAIGSLVDRCDLYLPRLRGSAYEGITACATSAVSGSWCWRTAKRSMTEGAGAGGFCRPAGATSPASPTARPRVSVGSCPAPPWDTATNGGRCRTGRPASTPAPFRRSAPSASRSTSIRPRRWSCLPERVASP